MENLNKWPIKGDFSIVRVDSLPSEIVSEQIKKYLGTEFPMLPKNIGVELDDLEKLKTLKGNLSQTYKLRLGLLHNDNLIGWTDGWQDSIEQDTFFMGSSLILPSYQRQGLYTALAQKVLEVTKNDGFQSVSSLHIMTNNAVLIAKLKMGFSIYGFEINTRYGALVRLVYHHNETKRRALRFRAGALHEPEILGMLK